MQNLKGANAILTGGSRGIGPYIARALAREGVNIVLAARDQQKLDVVRQEVEGLGVKALSVPTDVRSADDRSRLVEQASELGPIDVLVNNAGIEMTGEFAHLAPTDIEASISVNLTASALLMRMVLPGMVERHQGHIVNIASVAGKVPIAYDSVYSATKFALVGLSHAVREELRGSGVGVSVVCPGFVSDAGMYVDATVEQGLEAPSIAGTSKPEDVANAVVRVIRRNVAEAIVTPLSGQPLIVMGGVVPGAGVAMLRLIGVTGLFRQIAERRTSKS